MQKQICCFRWNCKPRKESVTLLSDSSCVIFSFMLINIITINFHSMYLLSYIINHLPTTSLCMLSTFLLVHINDNFSKTFVLSRIHTVEKIIFGWRKL